MIIKVVTIPVSLALAGIALAQNSTIITNNIAYPSTTIVSILTTVCGAATVLTQNGNYYTCTEAKTLTITDCPCTMTHPSYFANISTPTASPKTISISTITVPAFCPTTTSSYSPTLAQNADYTPTCQAPAGGGGGGGAYYGSPLSTPSQQGYYAAGTAARPSASSQYAYTSAGTRRAPTGSVGVMLVLQFFSSFAAVFAVAAVRLPGM